jgi:hypothetical protein
MAADVLNSLPHGVPGPEILPSTDGGLLLEWEGLDVDLAVEIDAAGALRTLVETPEERVEGEFRRLEDRFWRTLWRLSISP